MKTLKMLLCGMAICLALWMPASAAFVDVDSDTLANLEAGASLVVGDVHYENFIVNKTIATGGALEVNPADVTVTAGLVDGNPGMRFNLAAGAAEGQTVDIDFQFDVHAPVPITLVGGNLTGSATTGTGLVSLAEKVFDAATFPASQELADLPLSDTAMGNDQPFIMDPLEAQVAWITITKDLLVTGGTAGTASISSFFQFYELVPEPSSFTLIAFALAGLLGMRRRR